MQPSPPAPAARMFRASLLPGNQPHQRKHIELRQVDSLLLNQVAPDGGSRPTPVIRVRRWVAPERSLAPKLENLQSDA